MRPALSCEPRNRQLVYSRRLVTGGRDQSERLVVINRNSWSDDPGARSWRNPMGRADECSVWALGFLHECVDETDCNDGAQNDHPIGNLNARYRCFPARPFHDFPPHARATGQDRRRASITRAVLHWRARTRAAWVANRGAAQRELRGIQGAPALWQPRSCYACAGMMNLEPKGVCKNWFRASLPALLASSQEAN
jgi:hypothetical protein